MAPYAEMLRAAGLAVGPVYPTHVFLNRELGFFRFLNRLPGILLAMDYVLLKLGLGGGPATNKLLVAARAAS